MLLGIHRKQVEGSDPLAGSKGSQEHKAPCLPASGALWVAWVHTSSLKGSPGPGASLHPTTATQHCLVAPRTLPWTCPSPALCSNNSQKQESHAAPGLQPCPGTGPSGRAVLAADEDADRAQAPVHLGAGRPSLGLKKDKREDGPEPCDTEGHQGPAARASMSRVLQNQQGLA